MKFKSSEAKEAMSIIEALHATDMITIATDKIAMRTPIDISLRCFVRVRKELFSHP